MDKKAFGKQLQRYRERAGYSQEALAEQIECSTIFISYYTDNIQYSNHQLTLEDSFIRDRITTLNHYYIDENNVLWGTGRNQYWKLGLEDEGDINNLDVDYETPVKMAERVIHVDASDQDL